MITREVITPSTDRAVTWMLISGMLLFGAFMFVMGMRVADMRTSGYMHSQGYAPHDGTTKFRDLEIGDGTATLAKFQGAATLADSAITESSGTLSLANLSSRDWVDVECPDACWDSNLGRACFAISCMQRVFVDTITVNGGVFKDGDTYREYRDVVLNGEGWTCKRVGSNTECHNGAAGK